MVPFFHCFKHQWNEENADQVNRIVMGTFLFTHGIVKSFIYV